MRRFLRLLLLALSLIAPLRLPAQNDPESRRAAIEAIYPIMIAAMEAKNFGRARHICDQAILWEPQNPVHHYNLACIEAQAGGSRRRLAMPALELAVALGFDDANHLQNDPDLAPLHGDPKFAELVRKAALNATALDALSGLEIPPRTATPEAPSTSPEAGLPLSPDFNDGRPVGLYLRARFDASRRSLERTVWYFAPDGTVYRNLEAGPSPEALAAHAGPKGKASASGKMLEVAWADGQRDRSDVERDGAGFIWDMGIFTAATPFAQRTDLVGTYEAGASASPAVGGTAPAQQVEFREDGTFLWRGVAWQDRARRPGPPVSEPTGTIQGKWELEGVTLTLSDETGVRGRTIVLPFDDDKTAAARDGILLGGEPFRKR